ncbi:hypothetical protein QJS04_geneDACA019236 [Acorus gramineus]|uniref:Mitochondrial intermembrane space import and assembly protein 40 homolog n=1 Tax=Acorus gramineus TaxID=55184 RepID=A0AAV8ZZN6_ACOGR|nr:hypothetical protein QJS04_geneDACA019236 [Acorus gramineus]
MGQTQSSVPEEDRMDPTPPAAPSPQDLPSMEDLIAEATAYGEDENESIDARAQKALECPCIAELRNGPCGNQFSEAFVCFLKSTAEEKGSDCVNPFVALQMCIKANPNAFSKDILEGEGSGEEEEEREAKDYTISAPSWSRKPKSKL